MTDPDPLAGLIRLFEETPRQGPGDPAILDRMIAALAPRAAPRAADLGCGTGATARHLAEGWGADALALDAAAPFVERMTRALEAAPPARGGVRPVLGDMAAPPVEPGALDLIVSEAAAYALGLGEALALWRPLLAPGGGVVVSECVWAGPERPEPAAGFWASEYPGMGRIADAVSAAEAAGYRFVAAERLPSRLWRESYHAPLRRRIARLADEAAGFPALAAAIADLEREMAVFEADAEAVAYVYFAFAPA